MQNCSQEVLVDETLAHCMFLLGLFGHLTVMQFFHTQYDPPAVTDLWDRLDTWNSTNLWVKKTPVLPLHTLQWMIEQGVAEWGEIQEPETCRDVKSRLHPESFAWAHEHGCPCDCGTAEDSDTW